MVIKYNFQSPIKKLIDINRLSERAVAERASVSRTNLRNIMEGGHNITLRSICAVAESFGKEVFVLVTDGEQRSDFSTVATAYKVEHDGFESWKIHFMDLVDEFRRTLNPALVFLPPHKNFDKQLTALMASIISSICRELAMEPPPWSKKRYVLKSPWFPSGIEALKASAILESPLDFRRNNIFVQSNFLTRI